MNHKPQTNTENTHTSFSSLVDENYNDHVLEKITKEFLESLQKDNTIYDETSPETESSSIDKRNIIIAKSKGLLGIHFCENVNNFSLRLNDQVIIKTNDEYEFATIIETGKIVSIKRIKLELQNEEMPIIERVVTQKDVDRNISNTINSFEARTIFFNFIRELSLDMKLVDIHFQFDRKKLFFFYTSDGRVDFRELAKKLAQTFKTRIELRQMGVRDEAKRIGGIATCGREFCCTSFISNFKSITTDIAEENNITNSISKYTGPCGKLKCCLSFEID